MASGGPIESITIKGRRFAVDAESEMDLNLGGFTNEMKPNGDGSSRVVKSRRLAMAKGGAIVIDNDRGDQEFIQQVIDDIDPVDCDITLCDGTVYSGSMAIVGEPTYKTKESTMEIELSGTMAKQ